MAMRFFLAFYNTLLLSPVSDPQTTWMIFSFLLSSCFMLLSARCLGKAEAFQVLWEAAGPSVWDVAVTVWDTFNRQCLGEANHMFAMVMWILVRLSMRCGHCQKNVAGCGCYLANFSHVKWLGVCIRLFCADWTRNLRQINRGRIN